MGIISSKSKKKENEDEQKSAIGYEKLDNETDSSCEHLNVEDIENCDGIDPIAGSTAKQGKLKRVGDAISIGIDPNEKEQPSNLARSKSLSMTKQASPKPQCIAVTDGDTIKVNDFTKVSLKSKKAPPLLKRKEGELPALSSGKLGDKAKIRQELEEKGLLLYSYGTDILGELRGVGIIKESKLVNPDASDSGLPWEIRRRLPPRLAHLPIDHTALQEKLRKLQIGDAQDFSDEKRPDVKTVDETDKSSDNKGTEMNIVCDGRQTSGQR